jgi:hypothetical protein
MVSVNNYNTSSNDDSDDIYADMPALLDSDDEYADMPPLIDANDMYADMPALVDVNDEYADMPPLIDDNISVPNNFKSLMTDALNEAFMIQIERLNTANQTGDADMALSALHCINILLGNNI